MLSLLLTLCVATAATPSDLSKADSLRMEADRLTAEAELLRSEWDVLWKRSDSLRIESMLIRMKSNALKRNAWAAKQAALRAEEEEAEALATAEQIGPQQPVEDTVAPEDDAIVLMLAERSTFRDQLSAVRSGKTKSGQTVSDSITADVMRSEPDTGTASYYGDAFHGKKTSSGEVYNMWANTCAHRWLPFGTLVRVTNLKNNRSVVVRVTDRGPFHHGRLIDISKGAAKEIDMIRSGTSRVAIEVVDPDDDVDSEDADEQPAGD